MMWQSSGGDSGGLGLDSPEGSTNPKRTVSFGERSHDSSASQASYSPRSSPKLGLSMGTFRSEHTGEQSLGTSSSALRRRGSVLAADTFTGGKPKNSTASLVKNEHKYCGKVRRAINYLVLHHYTANFMGIVVLFDSFFTAFDIDARAVNESTPQIILTASEVCLVMYTLDFCLILLVYGISVMKDWMVILDTVIILCGYVELLFTRLEVAADVANGMGILRVLRMARIIRLMQLLRKTRSLKELQKLVTMMATCLKALAWSFVFCFVIMTIWAMLMVEMIHPLMVEMTFADCEECSTACKSVMDANLLLFKTVIAGDSWGQIAVPVIQEYPLTSIIFCGSLFTLVFGVLNLIVAVVVDTFAEVRESDVMNLAEEMEHASEADKKFLQRIFDRMDVERKGLLSFDDIMAGARTDPEFQSRLRVMDIDEVDLQQLFEMIDVDGSGAIEAEEFIVPLSRWVRDSKTAPRFIKYNLMHAINQQEELVVKLDRHFHILHTRMGELEEKLDQKDAKPQEGLGHSDLGTMLSPSPAWSYRSENEVVEQCHPSKNPLRSLKTDLALKPAVAALNQSLSEALKQSVAKMEAILQQELDKLVQSREISLVPSGPSAQELGAFQRSQGSRESPTTSGPGKTEACDMHQPEPHRPRVANEQKPEWRLSQRLHSV